MKHIRRFKLLHGVRVTFRFDGKPPLRLECEWDPEVPEFTSPRVARRFERAYLAARNEFMREVAQLIGGTILVADLSQDYRTVQCITAFKPETCQ
jgi:hypothetical protein